MTFVADWFSGKNAFGYVTPGFSFALAKSSLLNVGYSICSRARVATRWALNLAGAPHPIERARISVSCKTVVAPVSPDLIGTVSAISKSAGLASSNGTRVWKSATQPQVCATENGGGLQKSDMRTELERLLQHAVSDGGDVASDPTRLIVGQTGKIAIGCPRTKPSRQA